MEGAGPGSVRLEPTVAEISVLLVRQRRSLADDGTDRRGEDVQHEIRRKINGQRHAQRARVRSGHELADVGLGPAKLRQQEGRGFIQQHNAAQRKGGVLGRDRRAVLEMQIRAQRECHGPPVLAYGPVFSHAAHKPREVVGLEPDYAIVNVGDHLAAAGLIGFGWVERDQVVDSLGDNQGVWRRRC